MRQSPCAICRNAERSHVGTVLLRQAQDDVLGYGDAFYRPVMVSLSNHDGLTSPLIVTGPSW